MEKALITVVGIAYNEEKKIRWSLDCLVNQTAHNFNIIFVDDGSNDETAKILDEYANTKLQNMKVIHNKENEGISISRNKGIEEVKTPYFILLDGDDYLHLDAILYLNTYLEYEDEYIKEITDDTLNMQGGKEYLSRKIEELKEANEDTPIDILKYRIKVVDETHDMLYKRHSVYFQNLTGPQAFLKLFKDGKTKTTPISYAFRTEFWRKNNFKFPNIKYNEDYGIIPKIIFLAKNVISVQKCLYHYIDSKLGITRNKSEKDIIKNTFDTLKLFDDAIIFSNKCLKESKVSEEDKNIFDNYYCKALLRNAIDIYNIRDKYKKNINYL